MANNRIHTTFDLLSSNVYNQPSLQTIDLPFELIGYSGTVDSSTGITTKINKQELKDGYRIIIKGFDDDATYKVETEVINSVDNLNGTITFLVLDNFLFEITEIMFYVPNEVKVKHGTIMDGNIQLTSIKPEEEKYPLIFQHEITRETFFHDKRNKLERESEVDLFFLTTADFQKWDIDDHNKFAIKPMRELALKFIDELKTSNGIGEFEDYEILDHVRFGTYSTEKGHETRVFNDKLSGVQLKIKIPFLKTCGCNHAVVNIPSTPCIPRTITRTLKNSLANLADVDLTNPENEQILVYIDGVWVNQDQTSSDTVDWEDVTNKPTTFTPSAHTHPISEVVGLPDALDLKLNAVDYVQHFKGLFTTLLALQAAYPTANEGDYAQVDPGSGTNLQTYSYDLNEGWVLSSTDGSGANNTDQLPEGATNLYFTASRALAAAPAETVNTIGALVNGAASATPNDTDLVMSIESSVAKKNTWAQIKAFLKTYFDSIYQTQIDSSPKIILKSVADVSHTGDTNVAQVYSGLIEGGTFSVGNILNIYSQFRKTGSAGNLAVRLYVNTLNSLVGATQIAQFNSGVAANRYYGLARMGLIKSATNTEIFEATSSTISSIVNSNTPVSSINIDWNSDQYFLISVQLTNSADTGILSGFFLEKK